MATFKILFIVFMLASVPCFGAEAGMKSFMEAHGVSPQIQANVLSNDSYAGCFQSGGDILCVSRGKYANLESNPLARQSILRSLLIRARHMLYAKMLGLIKTYPVQNKVEADQVYLDQAQAENHKYLLKGMESGSYCENGLCQAYVAAPVGLSVDGIEAIDGDPIP